MEKENLHLKRFFDNLFLAGGTSDRNDYHYVGGDAGQRKDYFTLTAGTLYPWLGGVQVPHAHRCVCGVAISENCYLTNIKTHAIVTVGNCCIKKFMPEQATKRCLVCSTPKKHMKDGTCSDCKQKAKSGDRVVTFGKHKGKTYEKVRESDPQYCAWVLGQTDFKYKHFYDYLHYFSIKKQNT